MSRTRNNDPIVLTGRTFDRRHDVDRQDPTARIELEPATGTEPDDANVEVAGERFALVRVPFERGDIALYHHADMHGRAAMAGRHTNYGYSGYFRASLFDGKQWRALALWTFVLEADRTYASQGDRTLARDRLAQRIAAHAGHTAVWGRRAYELPAQAE